jgi:hypothetical protein
VEGRAVDIDELKKLIENFAIKVEQPLATEILSESFEGATVFRDMFPPS